MSLSYFVALCGPLIVVGIWLIVFLLDDIRHLLKKQVEADRNIAERSKQP